jgi:hypothetical protein
MGARTARRIAAVSAVSIPDAQAAQRLVDGARPLVAPD